MLKTSIEHLMQGEDLSVTACEKTIQEMLYSDNTAQIAAFMALLRAKPETVDEILGIAHAMRANMVRVPVTVPVLDIVGTGGDGANTINISTGASILAASCGVKIAKHGNRNVSSQCGAADVLEALGVNIELDAAAVAACIQEVGMGFCFAPKFHPALQHIKAVRSALGVATSFNIMGPLLNPASASFCMIGVFSESLLSLMADVIQQLPIQRAWVFHGAGLDEISCTAPVDVIDVTPDSQKPYTLDATEYGLKACQTKDLIGGTVQENAAILSATLQGATGPVADTLIFNAAVALLIYGKVSCLHEGVALAREQQQQGAGYQLLSRLAVFSHTFEGKHK